VGGAENAPDGPAGENEEIIDRGDKPFERMEQAARTSNPDATIEPQVERVKGLIDIPGIRVGHVSDYGAITGCTAILCEQGGVDIRGSATGTEEIATLDPGHVTDKVHGIVAGRRAFGLEAASGVRREGADRSGGDSLRSRDRPGRRVPLGRDGRSGRLGGKHGRKHVLDYRLLYRDADPSASFVSIVDMYRSLPSLWATRTRAHADD